MMTKGQTSGCTEMNAFSTVNSPNMWQMPEEDIFISCQEKVRQVMHCCQDVVSKLDTVHKHLASDRIRERIMPIEEDYNKTDVLHLQEKLRLSAVRINELELVEITVRKKIEDLEEKVQTLTAQLLVYKEDFDLERKDRELAHGRIAELEQLLMCQRARGLSSVVQYSHQHLPNHSLYQSFELVPRGHNMCGHDMCGYDVCDVYQTDGVPDVIARQTIEIPTQAIKAAEFIDQQDPEPSGSPMQLAARSFDFCDFFAAVASAQPVAALPVPHLFCSPVTPARGELFADGAEQPIIRAVTFSDEPSRKGLTQADRDMHCDAFPHDVGVVAPNFATMEPRPSGAWSLQSKNHHDLQNFSYSEANLGETDFPFNQNRTDNSKLICPKCRRSFSLFDHCLFLDHLEEC